ncbi:hypothetical protein ALC62_13946, partial [Cyphomyrmex costatus]
EDMTTFAIQQQQCLFELLPDCIIYKENEHEYLKQNIGYAIYGPPQNTESTSTKEDHVYCKTENLNDTDVVGTVGYTEDAQKVINKIYDKIRTSSVKTDDSGSIYCGVIYNMVFRPKTKNVKSKKKAKEETNKDKKDLLIVMPVPIFTIRNKKKYETAKKAKQESTLTVAEVQYETLYIDVTGRVYKNWTDYKENNNLPESTMVLPKHGFYESDPHYLPTEDYSTVWLEILESPSCKWKTKLCKGIDFASTVVGCGTIGLSIAALFTPLAPVVAISGVAAAGVTGVWSLSRNTHQLVDRSSHEESIHVLDREAFGHYLSMASTAFGLGAIGGTAIISNVAARGMSVNTLARVAFNTVQGGSLILSGIGIIYQGHFMYDKYKKDKTVSVIDALNLATHLMFFYGSVVKVKFASDIIESTQGKVINDYKETLNTKRLRKKFNKIARQAAENNTCKISENAEVILYIKQRQELLSNKFVSTTGSERVDSTSPKIVWSVDRGKLTVNGMVLLDPIEFVTHLIKLGIFVGIDQNDSSGPLNNANESVVEQLMKVFYVVGTVGYTEDAQNTINQIYDKIRTSSVETDESGSIYYGVIYNMIFRPKTNNEKPKKKEVKEEANKDEKNLLAVMHVPIFTIRNRKKCKTTKQTKQENTSTTDDVEYEISYIDLTGRVYKDWTDYKENNNLPECTMVLPKHGLYEPDLDYVPTEDYSTVWIEILESPSCKWNAKLCKGIDFASTVVGYGTIGLSIAALFTPLAPVVAISGVAAAGVTSVWSLGRNTQQLVDRSSHEESINVLNREAFGHYLSIASTAFGLGAIGGTAIISNVAARGMSVNTLARVAFNTVQGGSLILSGIGIIYQGHFMYDKYKKDKTVSVIDALNLATHLMFFCGSVVRVQFASDIIESTQGKVINDYKNSAKSRHLRKKFNKTVRKAENNNTCKISENAEVIRYIKHRQELLSNQPVTTDGKQVDSTSHKIEWSVDCGRLKVNGIVLLDPVEFVTHFMKLGIFFGTDQYDSSGPQNNANESVVEQLTKALYDLLSKFYASDDCPESEELPMVSDFEPFIREMSFMQINGDYLERLFRITKELMKCSKDMNDFLLQAFAFIWQYCKANVKQWGMTFCPESVSSNKILQIIIIAIFKAIDKMAYNLYRAFEKYMASVLHKNN